MRSTSLIVNIVLPSGFACAQAREHFDAIDRPIWNFLDAGADTRDVKQKESRSHESRHPDDLTEDLL
jgi:hypothetical protein